MAYLVSLPNPGHEGKPKFLRSDNPALIERWIKAENRPGFGVYYLPNPLKPGATTHSKENIAAIGAVYVDVDFKDVTETADEATRQLGGLLLPPTLLVASGHGCHLLWQLKEAVAHDDPEFESVCALQAALIDYLGADPQVRPWSLLRQPGTLNSKSSPHVPCEIIGKGPAVDITELREMVGLVDGTQLLTRKPRPYGGNGAAPAAGERKAPVDVEARLAAMQHLGAGPSSIHQTQLSTTASLLRGGVALQEATRIALEATRAAVANNPQWNWRHEELKILRMGFAFIVKHPELATLLPDAWRQRFADALAQGRRPDIGLNTGGFYVRGVNVAAAETAAPSKGEIIRRLLLKGTTIAEVCKAIGWERVSLQRYAHLAGLTLTKYQEDGVTKYKGVPEGPASEPGPDEATQAEPATAPNGAPPHGWRFYDSATVSPIRWLVKQLLPETGVGIVSGQWGSFKTTAALDLSVSVMTGQPFAGQYRIKRKGAVLYFATEGAGTLQSRLAALARHRGAPDKLPFAWRGDCPLLTDRDAGRAITKHVDEAAVHFEHAYGVPVTLIWVDTYITAAGLSSSGDDNDTAATQKAFNTLRFVAAHSGAFVATIDHLGKVVEAGTRGSSGKEGNADTVLATLAEREVTGAVSNCRMAARKQRDGVSGFEVPFTPETVELGLDEDGDAITAIILSWGKQQREPVKRARQSKDRDLLAHTLMDVVAKRGFAFVPDPGGPSVRACHGSVLRAEFCERRPAKGTAKQRADTCRRAFERALENARATGLVGVREANGEEVVWAR